MLYNIVRHEGEAAAMELLDALRSIRQQHPSIRMVFTGSIGLHNIIIGVTQRDLTFCKY